MEKPVKLSSRIARAGFAIVTLTLIAMLVIQGKQLDHYRHAITVCQTVFPGTSAVEIDRRFGPAGWTASDLDLMSAFTGTARAQLEALGITEARRYSLGAKPQMIWLEVFLTDGRVIWARICES
jgi:hypothetical protein